MSHKLCLALLLVLGLTFIGCGGSEQPAAGPVAVAPPAPPAPAPPAPAPPAPTEEVVDPAPGTTPETTPPVVDTPNTVEPEIAAPDTDTAANFVAAGPLAAHAKGLSVVRPDHYAIFKFDLRSARQAKLLQDLHGDPDEVLQQLNGGLVPNKLAEAMVDVEMLWFAIGPPVVDAAPTDPPFSLGAFAEFKDGESLEKIVSEWKENAEAVDHDGETYYRGTGRGPPPFFHIADNTLFIGHDAATIHQAIDAKGKIADLPLLAKLKDAPLDAHVMVAGSLGAMREPVTAALTELIRNSGLPLAPTTAQLPAQIEYGTIAIDLDGETLIDIDADMDQPQNAAVMKETLGGLVSLGKIMLGQQRGQLPDEPAAQQSFALVMSLVNAIKVEQNDAHVDVSLAHVAELDKLPAIVATAQGAAQGAILLNNGHLLGFAASNYKSVKNKLPGNLKNEAGEEVLSWRVAILPYSQELVLHDLHDQIDQQSAWDSDANAKLTETPVKLFHTPASDAPNTTTWKMVPESAGGMLFIAGGVGTAVPWAKPDTFVLDPADPGASLGEEPEDGYVVAMLDWSVVRMTTAQIKAKLAGDASVEPPTDRPDPEPEPAAAGPEERIWRTAAGNSEVKATFVKRIGDKITIRRSDNDMEVTIPVDILSVEDQDYLKSLKK